MPRKNAILLNVTHGSEVVENGSFLCWVLDAHQLLTPRLAESLSVVPSHLKPKELITLFVCWVTKVVISWNAAHLD